MSRFLRKLATRCIGKGPSGRIEPFAWHVRRQHENSRRGLDDAERLTGVVANWPGESIYYHPPVILTPDGGEAAAERLHPPASPRGFAPLVNISLNALSPGAVAGQSCLVYCPESRVAVEEAIKNWNVPIKDHPLFFAPGFPARSHLSGIGLVIGSLGIESFYHFLLEVLPKLAWAAPWLERIDHFIVNGTPGGWIEEWLVAAGLPRERLRWLSPVEQISCDQLLFFGMITRHHHATPPIINQLRTLWGRGEPPGRRKLWISRRNASSRRMEHEPEIVSRLPGFELVRMEEHSPLGQIELLRSASIIAGPHGAGLAGMVFAPPGTPVIEFADIRDPAANACFSRLAQVSGNKHYIVNMDFRTNPDLAWLLPRLT